MLQNSLKHLNKIIKNLESNSHLKFISEIGTTLPRTWKLKKYKTLQDKF